VFVLSMNVDRDKFSRDMVPSVNGSVGRNSFDPFDWLDYRIFCQAEPLVSNNCSIAAAPKA
jgi:hypothetical protein